MKVWQHILNALESHDTCAMISVTKVEGSAPREQGARIVVTPLGFHGSIGGGTLEWQAIAKAQTFLGKPRGQIESSHSLGPDLGQCCGGRVQLVTEVFSTADLAMVKDLADRECQGAFEVQGRIVMADFTERFGDSYRKLYLFGAGHVGRALILALAPLPFETVWIDPRDGAFPAVSPSHVKLVASANPAAELSLAMPQSFALVMTHDHGLDLEIVAAALANPHIVFTGLIGSATKRARFTKRLREAGIAPDRIDALACPIGSSQIKSKHPAVIAATTVVQLLEQDELLRTAANPVVRWENAVNIGAGRGAA